LKPLIGDAIEWFSLLIHQVPPLYFALFVKIKLLDVFGTNAVPKSYISYKSVTRFKDEQSNNVVSLLGHPVIKVYLQTINVYSKTGPILS